MLTIKITAQQYIIEQGSPEGVLGVYTPWNVRKLEPPSRFSLNFYLENCSEKCEIDNILIDYQNVNQVLLISHVLIDINT